MRLFIGLVLAALCPSVCLAQVTPLGPQFQVNTYTNNDQSSPDVILNPSGAFWVAWYSYGSLGNDGAEHSIQLRLFSQLGVPVGPEAQVNTSIEGSQRLPAMATATLGTTFFAWIEAFSNGSTGARGRVYQGQAQPNNNDFPLDIAAGTAPFSGSAPAVASQPEGQYVVTWSSLSSPGTDNDGLSILGRRFDSAGVPLTPVFQVNDFIGGDQINPDIVSFGSGNFLIVWDSGASPGDDSSGYSIQGRYFLPDGTPVAGQFQVNSTTSGNQTSPQVAGTPSGQAVVVWQSGTSAGTDHDLTSIQVRRFSSAGLPQSADTQVNTYTSLQQYFPGVSADQAGNFIITWSSDGSPGSDNSNSSIQARRFTSNGSPLEDQFQVNSFIESRQILSRIALASINHFLIVWSSLGSPGSDNSGDSIQGQFFVHSPIFSNGFETGDTSEWSATVP